MVEKPYVWGTCSNEWNSNQCFDHETTTESVPAFIGPQGRQSDARLPEQEFFDYSYLQEIPYISNITEFPVWHFSEAFQKINFSLAPIALLVTWLLVFLFIAFGPRDWINGFNLLMFGLPVWTAIPVSIGKWVGKVVSVEMCKNWLVVIFVYACIVQVPQLAMAPYLGNLLETKNVAIFTETMFKGFKVVFHSMPAAFAVLKCIAVMTIVDNIVDSLTSRYARFTDRRCCTTFVTSFLLILLLMGLGVLHMSKVGIYLIVLMDQSVVRLRFIIVILLAISLILVYGLWIYNFQQTINNKVSYNNYYLTDVWVLISWIISAIPYIAISSCFYIAVCLYDGSCDEVK
ncbi:unnamed protein product [Mytilus edulis]|uniref:Uncharacterized protein n=1 Tax=Mytilus edulis TaxID=6550 RepID=A0A8S3UCV2_MYTED|nr:unnamed protein product [Mytilus edulis]